MLYLLATGLPLVLIVAISIYWLPYASAKTNGINIPLCRLTKAAISPTI